MSWQFKASIAALLLFAVFLMVNSYNNALEDAQIAKAAQKTLEDERDSLKQRVLVLDAQMLEKTRYEALLRTQYTRLSRTLDDLKIADPATREWAATPLPDSVRKLLRENYPPRPAGPNSPDPSNSGTKPVSGGDQR